MRSLHHGSFGLVRTRFARRPPVDAAAAAPRLGLLPDAQQAPLALSGRGSLGKGPDCNQVDRLWVMQGYIYIHICIYVFFVLSKIIFYLLHGSCMHMEAVKGSLTSTVV